MHGTVPALVTTRPVSAGDEAFLFDLYASTRTHEMALVPWSEEEKRMFLRMQFGAQTRAYAESYAGAAFSIVECDGEPAGRVSVHTGAEEIRVVDIAMMPGWRGRGAGTAVMRAIFEEAERAGRVVTIHVERDNPALAWYTRLGFARVSERGFHYFMERRPSTGAACSTGSR